MNIKWGVEKYPTPHLYKKPLRKNNETQKLSTAPFGNHPFVEQ